MNPQDKEPLFTAQAYASNKSFIGSPKSGPLADMMRRDLAMQLADMIVNSSHLTVTEGEHETTFRIEVMVMSKDALYGYAEKIAEKIAHGRGGYFSSAEKVKP